MGSSYNSFTPPPGQLTVFKKYIFNCEKRRFDCTYILYYIMITVQKSTGGACEYSRTFFEYSHDCLHQEATVSVPRRNPEWVRSSLL